MKSILCALLLLVLVSACDGETVEQTDQTLKFEDVPVLKFGETAKAEGFEIELTDFDQRSQIGLEGLGPSASPEETFVVIRYRIKNVTEEPVDGWDFPAIDLVDGSGQPFSKHNEASALEAALSEDITGTGDLNPNVSAKLVTVWKVDKESFDENTWRVMLSFDSRIADAIAWPLEADSPTPILFALN